MSSSLGTAVLDLDTDPSRMNRGLDKAESKVKGSVGGFSAGTLAIGAAFTGVGLAVKNAWDELSNAQRVGAQTDAVLKSTGGVANVTKGHIEDLSTKIMNYSGLDDEVVQSGQNMLLTFTKVRNGVGKGNQIFDRATVAIADLSVGMGKDMSSSAIMVGKALNDPIKGLTALGRAGVQFTQAQKDSIKAMVDSGNTAGAQKMILKELETQFGGSAKAAGQTLPGQLAIARNAFDNMSAQLLSALIPALKLVATSLLALVGFLSANAAVVKPLVIVFATMATTILVLIGAVKAWAIAQAILNAVMAANPFILIATLLAGLVVAIIYAYNESETFRKIVQATWAAIKSAVSTGVSVVVGLFNTLRTAITNTINWVRSNWPIIATIISGPFAPLVALATNAFGIRSALTGAFTAIVSMVQNQMSNVIGAIRSLWDDARNAGVTLGQNIWNGISTGINKVAQLAGELGSKVQSAISSVAGSAASWAFNIGQQTVNGIINGLGGLFGALVSKLNSTLSSALDAVNPFSPVEHGGEVYIGRPIVEGALAGMDGMAEEMRRRLDGEVRGALSPMAGRVGPGAAGVIGRPSLAGRGAGGGLTVNFSGTVIGSGNERTLAQELARIVQPALDRRVSLGS
jgi:hypothetical protein